MKIKDYKKLTTDTKRLEIEIIANNFSDSGKNIEYISLSFLLKEKEILEIENKILQRLFRRYPSILKNLNNLPIF